MTHSFPSRRSSDRGADALALDVCPMSWPVGMGGEFEGIYDFARNRLRQPSGASKEFEGKEAFFSGIDDDALAGHLSGQGQIGSASVRERVCQYVWISVGGDSLKKKNRKNKHI